MHAIDRRVALLVEAALVGQLGVVLDVRETDLCVVAVEDAGDLLESRAPVRFNVSKIVVVK